MADSGGVRRPRRGIAWLASKARWHGGAAGGGKHKGYESSVRSSTVIQASSDAIRIPAPGMSKGSITSRSAWQNGPYPVAWMGGDRGAGRGQRPDREPGIGPLV
jgi:hypothetical protein